METVETVETVDPTEQPQGTVGPTPGVAVSRNQEPREQLAHTPVAPTSTASAASATSGFGLSEIGRITYDLPSGA